MKGTFITRAPIVLALVTAASMWGAQSASAAFTSLSAPFTSQSNLLTGFGPCSGTPGIGPTGLLDDGTSLYVTDYCNASTYRFSESGGDASTPAASATNGLDFAVAAAGGRYYGASAGAGASPASPLATGIYEFDPVTLAITRTLTTSLPGRPRAIAVDPQTGDLFVTMSTGGVERIASPELATPVISTFASSADALDGAAFSPDGSLLYVADATSHQILGFNRAGQEVMAVSLNTDPDGVAVVPANRIVNGVDMSGNVFTDDRDGSVMRIDTNNGNAVSVVATGGTRGDFATVDSQGFLDVSQSDSYVRLYPGFFAVLPTNTALPTISGTPKPNNTLTCSQGTWANGPLSYSYRWRLNGIDTSTTTQRYVVPANVNPGAPITCSVTASNTDGRATAVSDAVYVPPIVGPLSGPRSVRLATVFCRAGHLAACHGIKISVQILTKGRGTLQFGASTWTMTALTRRAAVPASSQLAISGPIAQRVGQAPRTFVIVFKVRPSARAARLERQIRARAGRSIDVAFAFVSASGQHVTEYLRIALKP